MVSELHIQLCGIDNCRRLEGHRGEHSVCPNEAWNFFHDKDKKKLVKAGFATPRGGSKGAYQNHVVRSNKVIIPFERLARVDLSHFKDGYVIRLYPEQYFLSANNIKPEFLGANTTVKVGENAFVIYRTRQGLRDFPPLQSWQIRKLFKNGAEVSERGEGVIDTGHYVLRISGHGNVEGENAGPPQGLFAPEYADDEVNYLCKCVLAWLIIHTVESPYTSDQASHLNAILANEGLLNLDNYELKGVIKRNFCACPLCSRTIYYNELHDMVSFEDAESLSNAPDQLAGSTRSTIISLFHLEPLRYEQIKHVPENVAWGHAICNTKLGQRRCYSLEELKNMRLKVGIVRENGVETFGWISEDKQMIRSSGGAVWIQINADVSEDVIVDVTEETP